MNDTDLATKQDLRLAKSDLSEHIVGLKSDMKYEMAALRVELRNDMKTMFDDVLNVLGDMLIHIDKRFNKLETIVEKHGRDIKRLENTWH